MFVGRGRVLGAGLSGGGIVGPPIEVAGITEGCCPVGVAVVEGSSGGVSPRCVVGLAVGAMPQWQSQLPLHPRQSLSVMAN